MIRQPRDRRGTASRLAVAALLTATLAAVLAAGQARAAEQCTLAAADDLNFGRYNVFDTQPTRTTTIVEVRCTNSSGKWRVTLSSGGSGVYAQRRLAQGDRTLGYNIFADAAETQVVGDGAGGTVALVPPSGNLSTTRFTLYGHIDPVQVAPPGVYQDSIRVTLEF